MEKGILAPSETLSETQAYQLIFAPGFSTKEQVTDVSGRGVGMDVVKTNINRLQGDIEIETKLGRGTCFRIVLPLSLAIMDAMVVRAGEESYVIPLYQIRECVRTHTNDLTTVLQQGRVLHLRGETLAVFSLSQMLGRSRSKPLSNSVYIVAEDNHGEAFTIEVDEIIRQQQVVIKNLGREIAGYPGLSGAAILGDGKVAFILDAVALVQGYRAPKVC